MRRMQAERSVDGSPTRVTRYPTALYLELPDERGQESVPDAQCRVFDCSPGDLRDLGVLVQQMQLFLDDHRDPGVCALTAEGWTGIGNEYTEHRRQTAHMRTAMREMRRSRQKR